jgi:hypothetical protein
MKRLLVALYGSVAHAFALGSILATAYILIAIILRQ